MKMKTIMNPNTIDLKSTS